MSYVGKQGPDQPVYFFAYSLWLSFLVTESLDTIERYTEGSDLTGDAQADQDLCCSHMT